MNKFRIVKTAVATLAMAVALSAAAGRPQDVKLLAMGWTDSPKLRDLTPGDVTKMEAEAPFDGMCFDVGAMNVMDGARPLKYDKRVRELVTMHKRLPFKKFKNNFVATMMDQDRPSWLSTNYWDTVAANWGVAAKAAKEGGFVGIRFDPEGYGVYPVQSYFKAAFFIKGGTTLDKTVIPPDPAHTEADYVAAARECGRRVGKAVFKEFPSIKLFSFYWWSFNADLMGAFCNGILDVMPSGAQMIDGDEWNGYCAKGEADYKRMQERAKTGCGRLDKKHNHMYRVQGGVAPAFYLDAYLPGNDSGCLDPTVKQYEAKNRSKYFAENLKEARRVSSGFIWIYGEKGTWWRRLARTEAEKKSGEGAKKPLLWEDRLPGIGKALFGKTWAPPAAAK